MVRREQQLKKSTVDFSRPIVFAILLVLLRSCWTSPSIVSAFRLGTTIDRTTRKFIDNNKNIVRRDFTVRMSETTATVISGDNEQTSGNSNSNTVDDLPPTKLPRIDGSVSVGKTKWLELRTCDYTDQEGASRKWDYATRTTKQSSTAADAVVIIPLLTRYKKKNKTGSDGDDEKDDAQQDHDDVFDTILVEQFRPPLGQATFEFPAGLIDANESPEQAALRELREETGYVGEACRTIPKVSRPVCMSPGISDETVHVVVVMVDLDNPYNEKDAVTAQPDAGEYIKIHRVSMKDGLQTLLDKGESPMAIQGLYLFALGLELGKTLK